MKINNNIQALNAYRNLHQNQFNTSRNLEKLSSGLRINRASDDAAGLAISEKMRSQIRGLKMAERNAMDGISLMQTSEGAMQEAHTMLQRMRELAVQAANDTNTAYDREQIQKEIEQLKLEIDDISEKTEFNTRKLLNGSSAVLTSINVDADNVTKVMGVPKVLDANLKSGEYTVNVVNSREVVKINQPVAGLTNPDFIKLAEPSTSQAFGEYTINIREFATDNGVTSARIEVVGPDGLSIETKSVNMPTEPTFDTIGGVAIDISRVNGNGTVKVSIEQEASLTISKDGSTLTAAKTLTSNNGVFRHGGMEFSYNNDIVDGNTKFSLTNNALAFQIGPNTNQNVMIDIPRMDVVTLGIEAVDVTTNDGANKAIFQLDQAINRVSEARAKLGAVQNRMEHTINNLQVTHENLTASESRIRDADMALEMTEFTRNNILNQSATAMLAQANQLPQGVLQLLQ
ncbi:flagellin N-terminal helical domain-containing protein [Halalkalibacter akibai]|uniref:Flagellin n=1 Tax=Halalkalibacter akibai (strain ATCC 43226 / DSM 21942 / CIP 109018 / JCM 9157 / 1139) TaxID=1236973 RepID=W4QNN1_HALA3|nr:flagellin [Halalkalibacter akibai]GAE33502.1 flagellin protein FlaA [Halalkalibacter akibai JCM 9157]